MSSKWPFRPEGFEHLYYCSNNKMGCWVRRCWKPVYRDSPVTACGKKSCGSICASQCNCPICQCYRVELAKMKAQEKFMREVAAHFENGGFDSFSEALEDYKFNFSRQKLEKNMESNFNEWELKEEDFPALA